MCCRRVRTLACGAQRDCLPAAHCAHRTTSASQRGNSRHCTLFLVLHHGRRRRKHSGRCHTRPILNVSRTSLSCYTLPSLPTLTTTFPRTSLRIVPLLSSSFEHVGSSGHNSIPLQGSRSLTRQRNQTEETYSMRYSLSSVQWLWASLLMFPFLVLLTGETRAEPNKEETFAAEVIK